MSVKCSEVRISGSPSSTIDVRVCGYATMPYSKPSSNYN